MSIMANHWAEQGGEVVLVTLSLPDSDFYSLDSRVQRISIDGLRASSSSWGALKNNAVRIFRLRAALKGIHPDFIVSILSTTNILTLLATRGLIIPVAVYDGNDPRHDKLGKAWNWLRQRTYGWAEAVVVQTPGVRDPTSLFAPKDRIHVIPNPVLPPPCTSGSTLPFAISRPFIVAMGRLVPQKGFDLLLEAFARSRLGQHCTLVILGEGPERHNLENLAARLGIKERLCLPGLVREPTTVLRQAALFVLSSRYEGLPNALLEAMSCSLPVISFDCQSGPRDIIEDGVNGVLLPPENVTALSIEMGRLMNDEAERLRLGANACSVTETFSVNSVMGMWNALLNEIGGAK